MMEDEEILSEQESLRLITTMINKAKNDFIETGISALMWGSIVTFCALIQFASYFYNMPWAGWVWLLTIVAVIPQVVISIQERRKMKFKTHEDNMGGIWIAFAITMFLVSFYFNSLHVPPGVDLHPDTLILIIYGIPTFATGFARHFTPMFIGGIACWVLAIISFYTPYPYVMLLVAGAALIAWFIPGLILQRRYIKAKQQHV